jgi:DNA-binding CsgD family transcriptional regulator
VETMTSPLAPRDALLATLRTLRRDTGASITFGAYATPGGARLDAFVGAHSHTLAGVLIEPARGVGGKAMVDRRPVAATQYERSTAITHHYDREVSGEAIVSLLAVPAIVGDRVRAVLYVGERVATQFGGDIVRRTVSVAQNLAWEFTVAAEVERRVSELRQAAALSAAADAPSRERQEVREAAAELRELSRVVQDPELLARIDAIGRLLLPAPTELVAPRLSPREVDMVTQLALGRRNSQIAEALGLTEATVKAYVSSAMRKLDASSRFEAVAAARRAGIVA